MVRSIRQHYITQSVLEAKLEIASAKRMPVNALLELSLDDCDAVRLAVASNPGTPLALLACMSNDRAQAVRAACAKRLNTPNN